MKPWNRRYLAAPKRLTIMAPPVERGSVGSQPPTLPLSGWGGHDVTVSAGIIINRCTGTSNQQDLKLSQPHPLEPPFPLLLLLL